MVYSRPPVIRLETQNFEAYTQAATGQTTGTALKAPCLTAPVRMIPMH